LYLPNIKSTAVKSAEGTYKCRLNLKFIKLNRQLSDETKAPENSNDFLIFRVGEKKLSIYATAENITQSGFVLADNMQKISRALVVRICFIFMAFANFFLSD